MTSQNEENWRFTTHRDKAGRIYVIAYRNRWIPELKQSRREACRHVGRLQTDGSVAFCQKWLESYPDFGAETFFYEDHNLVTRSPRQIQEAKKASPYEYRMDSVQTGLTLGVWRLAVRRGILEDLTAVFGADTAKTLLHLGIYQLDMPGSSLMSYEDWLPLVFLPEATPLDSRRLSEVLQQITQEKMDDYFKRRHTRAIERLRENGSESSKAEMALAIDSTSISTYSKTITDAEYGHAKQDADLKQINLTFACDYDTGDALYAYECSGSINDMSSFPEILYRMGKKGFDLSKTILVTDRGYSSIYNVQTQLNTDQKFVQGIPLKEDAIKRTIDQCRAVLQDPALYSPKYQVASVTKTETWKRATDSGSVDVPVYVHIYYDESLAHDEKQILLRKIDNLLEIKNKNLQAESDDWNKYKNYLIKKEVRNKENNCIVEWIRDDVKIRHTLKHSGFFVIRSNLIADALSALEIYRRRNIVEQAFNQYKNQTEGSRMYATQSTYMGKLFVHIIAQALRMTLYMNAKNTSALNSSLMLPNESLSRALAQLRTVMSVRSAGCNYWILRPVTKKQRDLLALLKLDLTKSKNRMVTH